VATVRARGAREWDNRVGTVELAIPKLREASYFADRLLTHAEQAPGHRCGGRLPARVSTAGGAAGRADRDQERVPLAGQRPTSWDSLMIGPGAVLG
jgi:hypothetical protein